MKITNDNQNLWEITHSDATGSTYEQLFPSSQLLAFFAHHALPFLQTKPHATWLEYGCGSGLSISGLIKLGLNLEKVILADVAFSALEKAQINLNLTSNAVSASYSLISQNRTDINSESIDIVNAESSIYYNSFQGIGEAIEEIFRLLRPEGIARIVIKSDKDRYAKKMLEISPFTYIVDQPNHWENGMTVTCIPYDQVLRLFERFSNLQIGIEEYSYIDLDEVKSFWIVTCLK